MDGVCGGRSCCGRIPDRVRKYPQTGQERSRSGGAPPGPVGTEPRGAGRRYGPHPEDHYLPQAGRHGAFHYARGRRFAVGREDDVGGHRRGGHFGLEPPQPGGAQRQDQRRVRRVGPAGIAGPELAAGRRSAAAQGGGHAGVRSAGLQRRPLQDDAAARICALRRLPRADRRQRGLLRAVRRQESLFPLYGPRGGAADEVCRRRSPSGTDDARGGDVRQAGGMDDARGASPAVRPAAPLRHGDRPQGAGTDLLHAGCQRQVRPSERLFCAALPACLYGRRRAARRRDLHPRAGRIPGRRGP